MNAANIILNGDKLDAFPYDQEALSTSIQPYARGFGHWN